MFDISRILKQKFKSGIKKITAKSLFNGLLFLKKSIANKKDTCRATIKFKYSRFFFSYKVIYIAKEVFLVM